MPDAVTNNCSIVPQVQPPTSTMLAAVAADGMHSSLMHPNSQDQLSNNNSHLHYPEAMSSSIYVDINSISASSISTPPTTSLSSTACLNTGIRPGNSLTPNPQHLLSSNPATPLMQHALHNSIGNIQNVGTSAGMQPSPLQQHEQQLAAAATAAAVAAATAAAAHRQQQQQHQQQLHQLHQIQQQQQQQHHQLMMMQQQHQNQLQMDHHALHNPFHHHALQSAQLAADSIVAFTPQ